MEIITDHENILNSQVTLMPISLTVFHIVTKNQKSKTVDFFKDLYTYPPKFKIKWDSIDELYEDLMLPYNYNLLDHRFTFVDTLKTFFNSNSITSNTNISDVEYFQNKLKLIKTSTIKRIKYYSNNYFNKHASINFYAGKTKQIQQSIENIPVYAIVQGQQGEIILASSKDTKGILDPRKANAYNFYSGFRNADIGDNKLGLFFMSRNDAEVYLKEIATTDVISTKTLGLSIECVSLDFAYRVTREYHPGLDFRFIPNLEEVKNLLSENAKPKSTNIIFEDDQQQLRVRKSHVKIKSFFGLLIPFSSFLSNNESFKGVPIYIVQIHKSPRSSSLKHLFETKNILDTLSGKFINGIDFIFGLDQNSIVQGSIVDGDRSDKVTNYIFFDKISAINFCNSSGGKIARYDDGKLWRLDFIRKPKIFVHNLEDFLELWEDNLLKKSYKVKDINNKSSKIVSIFDTEATYFVRPAQTIVELADYNSKCNNSSLNQIKFFFVFKTRLLSGWTERFLNTN
jgi:hypothetical protein